MRAAYQILAIPYQTENDSIKYCVFHRADVDQWQFISGGGEGSETPFEAAKREAFEEGGILSNKWIALRSIACIPASIFPEKYRRHWAKDTYVIPEYTFGVSAQNTIKLSNEHTQCVWLSYKDAYKKLTWDSNRTALYELNCRLNDAFMPE